MMVVGKNTDDLGLSLSLGFSNTTTTTTNAANNNNTASTSANHHILNHNNNIPTTTTSTTSPHTIGAGFMMMNHHHHPNDNNNNNNNNNHRNHQTATTTAATTSSSNASLLQLNLMMMPSLASSSTASPSPLLQKLPWNRSTDSFPPSSDRNSENRSFLRGIDVNRPAGADEEDAGVSSPNSTVSTLSGKRSSGERDSAGGADDIEVERASSRGLSDDEDGGDNSRKKLRLTKDQSAILEESFKEHNTLNPKQKLALAKRLGLRPRQVEVWFQNRRARTKLKQTEVDCEFLKRCCEQLTEENRRLQKEVQELRALKLSPQFYMQMTPPTTLTMCPSCERVAVPPSAPTTTSAQTCPDPRPNPSTRHRPMIAGANPWVTTPVPIRSFDPRS